MLRHRRKKARKSQIVTSIQGPSKTQHQVRPNDRQSTLLPIDALDITGDQEAATTQLEQANDDKALKIAKIIPLKRKNKTYSDINLSLYSQTIRKRG